MSQHSTIARAAQLERPGIAWIGRCPAGPEVIDFTVTEADHARDSAWAAEVLGAYGIGRGSHVLITATPSETPWVDSFRAGAAIVGAVHSNAEPWNWDARRAEMYIRRLQTQILIGLAPETITAMAQLADVGERLGSIRTILARPAAIPLLTESGIDAGVYLAVGPAVAVSAPDGEGLIFNSAEWSIESVDGQLVVSTVGPRAANFDRVQTGIAGEVITTPNGPRVILT